MNKLKNWIVFPLIQFLVELYFIHQSFWRMIRRNQKLIEWTCGGILLGMLLLWVLPVSNFLVEMSLSILPFVSLGLVGLTLLMITLKFWRGVVMSIVGTALTTSFWFVVPDVSSVQSADFSTAHFNVWVMNHDHVQLEASVRAIDADVVSFQEVNYRWEKELETRLSDLYPYRILVPHIRTRGLALFSKYPLNNEQVGYWVDHPNITATVQTQKGAFKVVVSHTSTPITPGGLNNRNAHMREIAKSAQNTKDPVVTMGDYNCVPWSRAMKQLKKDGDLADSRKSYVGTYPAWLKIGAIPIDYILYGKGVDCVDFRKVDTNGSDHYGVVGYYQFEDNKTAMK